MDFGDTNISQRLKKAREKKQTTTETETPFDPAESYRIRGKMLGVLIRDARRYADRTPEECARLLGVSPQQINAWEYGDAVPDLPQLELLAYYLDVPISHFWGAEILGTDKTQKRRAQQEYMQLRHRMIGALLRDARESQHLTLEQVAAATYLDPATLQRYELGEIAIPMHELQSLAGAVDRNVSYFLEGASYVGELLQIREEWKHFTELDDDVRQFAANPLNLGFIKIAIMFSRMPTKELRKVAEGLLDITM